VGRSAKLRGVQAKKRECVLEKCQQGILGVKKPGGNQSWPAENEKKNPRGKNGSETATQKKKRKTSRPLLQNS